MSQASFKKAAYDNIPFRKRLLANRTAVLSTLAVGVATTITLGTVIFSGDKELREQEQAVEVAIQLREQPEILASGSEAADEVQLQQQEETAQVASEPVESLRWSKQIVRNGDNLTTIFQRVLLGAADVHRLMTASPLSKPLTAMKPGEELRFAFSEDGALAQVNYIKSRLESYIYKAAPQNHDAAYIAEHVVREPEVTTAFRESVIEDSLFLAGERAQLPHSLIMEVANIFAWDVDFALDIRKGDHFALLYEEKFLDGEKIGTGNVLAAEFTNQGRTFRAVRYVDTDGNANYYTPEGLSMRKAFLRAPLDFTRVSSNFDMRRLHPVFKTVRPHRGIDYAAATGTPVYAAGDGKVIASGYSKANGNYVFVQHGQRYTTKYLHLNKRSVKTGQNVRQRQVVGTVGSTGYATGPHLHYEFLVNGVHQNPRTVALPKALPIDDAERASFSTATAALMDKLQLLQKSTQLAMLTEKESQQRATQ